MKKKSIALILFFFAAIAANAQDVYQLKGPHDDDFDLLAKDSKGNVIIGGETQDSAIYRSLIIKTLNRHDLFTQSGTSADIVIIKQDKNDNILWEKTFGGYGTTSLIDMAVDDSDNIIIIGNYSNGFTFEGDTFKSNNHTNGFMLKIDSNGKSKWMKIISCSDNDAYFQSIQTYKATGDIYLKGYFTDTFSIDGKKYFTPNSASFISRIDKNGNVIWLHFFKYTSISNVGYYLDNIQIDNSGNILVPGQAGKSAAYLDNTLLVSSDTANRFILFSLNNQGVLNWVKSFDQKSYTGVNSIKVVNDGSIYLTGFFTGYITFGSTKLLTVGQNNVNIDQDIYLAKLDNSGNPLWAESFGAPQLSDNQSGLYIDDNSNMYIYMWYENGFKFFNDTLKTNCLRESLVALVTSDGNLEKYISTKGTSSISITNLYDVLVSNGTMYMAGLFSFQTQFGTVTLKTVGGNDGFLWETTSLSGIELLQADNIGFSIYPNPVESWENISYSLLKNSMVNYTIGDIEGRILLSGNLGIQAENLHNYSINVSGLKPGMYILSLTVDGNPYYKKIIKN